MEKKVFLKNEKNFCLQLFSGTVVSSVPCPFSQAVPQYILAHVKEHKCQVGCSTEEGRPGAKDRSKVGRGNDLTGKGWSPTVPKQG